MTGILLVMSSDFLKIVSIPFPVEHRLSMWYIFYFLSSFTLILFSVIVQLSLSHCSSLSHSLICSRSLLLALVCSRLLLLLHLLSCSLASSCSLALSHSFLALMLSCANSQSRSCSFSLRYNLFYALAHVDTGSILDWYAKSYHVFTSHGSYV